MSTNPAAWPPEVVPVFEHAVTVEFATLTRAGTPVTVPTTPYRGNGGETIDVSTGLTYPAKAERARREPRVALLFADPIGAGLERPPVVLVQGLATVRDADLQANTDRYIRASMEKLPAATKGQPRAALRRMAWYYARIWVEVTPLHIRWWPSRDLQGPAQEWHAPEGTAAPLSDPAPPGKRPGAWIAPPADWRAVAREALHRLPLQDLTVVGPNGFPVCVPVAGAELTPDGVRLQLGPGAPALAPGPACLTLHCHPEEFTGQENRTLIGTFEPDGDGTSGGAAGDRAAGRAAGDRAAGGATGGLFRVERALADWSLAGNKLRMAAGFLRKGRVLSRRLHDESARRGQAVPEVRIPGRA